MARGERGEIRSNLRLRVVRCRRETGLIHFGGTATCRERQDRNNWGRGQSFKDDEIGIVGSTRDCKKTGEGGEGGEKGRGEGGTTGKRPGQGLGDHRLCKKSELRCLFFFLFFCCRAMPHTRPISLVSLSFHLCDHRLLLSARWFRNGGFRPRPPSSSTSESLHHVLSLSSPFPLSHSLPPNTYLLLLCLHLEISPFRKCGCRAAVVW